MKFRPWLEGAGLGMMYLLLPIGMILAPGQDDMYHQLHPTASLSLGILLSLGLMTLVLGAGLFWLQRIRTPVVKRIAWLCVMFVTVFIAERALVQFLHTVYANMVAKPWMARVPWIALVAGLLALIASPRIFGWLIETTEVFLMSAGLSAVFLIVPSLLLASFRNQHADHSLRATVVNPWQTGQTRVIWLLFDELSYNQVFDHPQPGLQFPAFDELKQQSVSFSDVQPIGDRTEIVIPSLLQGHYLHSITSNSRGDLLWRESKSNHWQLFDPSQTLFAAAKRSGWSTGVVGWYNPYCRLFANVLDRCDWISLEFSPGGRFNRLSSEGSSLANAWNALPLVGQVENRLQHIGDDESHKRDFEYLLGQAKALIADKDIRFVFIHLPIPHPPGIYPDPLSGREDYLGNLILSDRTLAELRASIAATPAAKDTILIVSSDHSWRIPLWRPTPQWTREEERATNGGVYDTRPVLIVHFPNETVQEARTIDQPVSLMMVHKFLLGMFSGEVASPVDIERETPREEKEASGL